MIMFFMSISSFVRPRGVHLSCDLHHELLVCLQSSAQCRVTHIKRTCMQPGLRHDGTPRRQENGTSRRTKTTTNNHCTLHEMHKGFIKRYSCIQTH